MCFSTLSIDFLLIEIFCTIHYTIVIRNVLKFFSRGF